jgi:hypothetical protein
MFTFGNEGMTKWAGGFGGTPTTESTYFSLTSGWTAPDGHTWAVGSIPTTGYGGGGGVLVH